MASRTRSLRLFTPLLTTLISPRPLARSRTHSTASGAPASRAWSRVSIAAVLACAALPSLALSPAAPPVPLAPAAAVPAQIPLVWDVRVLFATDAAWEAERQAFLADLPGLASHRGTLAQSPAALRAALDRLSTLEQRLRRLGVYASTQLSADNRDARNQEREGLMQGVYSAFGAAKAWVAPEVLALGAEGVERAITAEPGLARHAVGLRDTLRQARHNLGPETEAALAALAPVTQGGRQARTLLMDVDIDWPELSVDGKPVRINANGYSLLRQHPDRAVRQQVFAAFYGRLGQYENTLGATLAARMRAGTITAKLRHYPNAVSASLSANQVPEAVVRTLVAQAHASLPTLHRYFKLRQRMLKLPDLHYHDIYPELVVQERRYPVEEAARLTVEATRVLGPDYQRLLGRALSVASMHVKPAPGKSSGAYQSGVYGEVPFVFLNHQDSFSSVSTFAHEWGHGVHTLLANEAQPFETARYPLFVAEVASITNEVLLGESMLSQTRSRDERLFQLGHALEEMRGTFFRQTMFAEFELQAHDALERGEALNGKKMTALYCQLLRQYHGADQGVMQIDPRYCSEWAYIPHFYNPFYVYQYATSMAAAASFGPRILAGEPGLRDTYLNVLRAGGSAPPYELLKNAGVDLASPAPYQALAQRMNRIMDEMEQLLASGG